MDDKRRRLQVRPSLKWETLSGCPNCGGRATRPWCDGSDRLHRMADERFHFERCSSCHVSFMSPRPEEENIGRFYPEDYGPYVPSGGEPRKAVPARKKPPKSPRWKRVVLGGVRRLNRAADVVWPNPLKGTLDETYGEGNGRSFLDFGCGSDAFLNLMRKKGWTTTGMDVSSTTVDFVVRSGHRGILVNSECWTQIEDESLDLVRMNHVLEHLYRPKAVLRELRRKLRRGGVLHIAVPNPASFGAQAFKSAWYPLECPRHIIFYPRARFGRCWNPRGLLTLRFFRRPWARIWRAVLATSFRNGAK